MNGLTGEYTFLSAGLVIQAVLDNGQLVKASGEKVLDIEPIEMDVVLIHRTDGVEAIELNDRVRWLPEKEGHSNGLLN